MRPAVVLGAALLLLAVGGATARADADADDAELARLRAAVAAHPRDPDLAWALARALVEAGRRDEARERLARDARRWPARAEPSLLLGTLLAEDGRHAEAVPHLERAVALEPHAGTARFRLALSLRHLGRHAEAAERLREAGAREPDLRGEALLLRGMDRLERGDARGGAALLREAIALDPDGETARSARLALRGREPEPDRDAARFRLGAYAGMEYDSNVALDSGVIPGLSSERDDGVGVWGASLRVDVLRGERRGLTLGARVDERNHLSLEAYDEKDLAGFFSVRLHETPRTRWLLGGVVTHALLDDESYLTRGRLRPSAIAILGERTGVARVFGEVETLHYEDDPSLASLERDGLAFGGGLVHHVPLPGWSDGWGAWRIDYRRYETEADRDLLGFGGAYDHDRYRGGLEARLPLPWRLEVLADVSLAHERYHHDNLIDHLTEIAQGEGQGRRRRRDLALETRVALVRPITSMLDVEIHWRFVDRSSNADLYDYERHSSGVRFRIDTF